MDKLKLPAAILLGAFLLFEAGGACFAANAADDEPQIKGETWKSMTMEAQSIKGEMMYQDRDYGGAGEMFRDSLGESTRIREPQGALMGLDLYRAAEIEVRQGRFAEAREHLDILLNRYPDSEWAARGERLRSLIPERGEASADDDEYAPAPAAAPQTPESHLSRLQIELKEDRVEDALRDCRAFLELYPRHRYGGEARLLEGLLLLRLNDPAQAARVLEPLAKGGDAAVASKASYLLGAAYFLAGDQEALRAAVPAADPRKAPDKWTALSQVWRAASDDRLGRKEAAASRYRAVLETSWPSPLKAYAAAAAAVDADRGGRAAKALGGMKRAAREAGRWGLDALAGAARLSVAHLLYRQRSYPAAAAAYEDFLRLHPDHPARPLAFYQRGLALKRAGMQDQAVAAFQELVESYPDSPLAPDGHLQLGQLYTDMGAQDRALKHYDEMAKASAARPGQEKESLLLMAQVFYNKKQYKEAIPYYWRFLQQAPGDPRSAQVEDLLLTAYWQGAKDDPGLVRAVSLYPHHPIAAHILWELGAEAYKAKDFRAAAERFDGLIAGFPKAPMMADALFYQGESRRNLQDYDGAAGSYRRLTARYPKSKLAKEAASRLADVLYEAGRYEESASAYKRLASMKGAGALAADAVFNRALALTQAGNKPGALAAYEELLKRFPSYPRAGKVWFQVGRLREAMGRPEPAAQAYARATGGNRPQALFSAGRIYEKLKRAGRARRVYEVLARARPAGDPYRLSGLVRLGLMYEMRGKSGQALPLYREALRLSDNETLCAIAGKRVAVLAGESPEKTAEYVTWAEGAASR